MLVACVLSIENFVFSSPVLVIFSVEIAAFMQENFGISTLLHLQATNTAIKAVSKFLVCTAGGAIERNSGMIFSTKVFVSYTRCGLGFHTGQGEDHPIL